LFTSLNEAQADGLACVECGRPATEDVPMCPVGVSEAGGQVFACDGQDDECVARAIVRGLNRGITTADIGAALVSIMKDSA
jgi:hypothetical protein